MKIALVCPYDFSHPGGVANHITSLERQLTRMGQEVKIISPASEEVTAFGNRFISLGKPLPIPSSGSIARVSVSPCLRPRLDDLLEEEKFDVVHLHEPLMPTVCTSVLKLSNTANIGTFHAYDGNPGYRLFWPLGPYLLRVLIKRLDGRVAVSEPARSFAAEHFPGKYDIIPNGVDTGQFSPDVEPIEELCDGRLNILFVGRQERRKGADYLLKAYKWIKREVPHSRLIFVGPGTRLKNKYGGWIRQNGLDQDIVFAGLVKQSDLPRYYRSAHVFCAPATGCESFGIVLLEAMACGVPVVASQIDGYSRVMTDNVEGLLVPPKSEDTLARVVVKLLRDEPLRQHLGMGGVAKAAKYDWKIIAHRLRNYYIQARRRVQEKEECTFGFLAKDAFNKALSQRTRLS